MVSVVISDLKGGSICCIILSRLVGYGFICFFDTTILPNQRGFFKVIDIIVSIHSGFGCLGWSLY